MPTNEWRAKIWWNLLILVALTVLGEGFSIGLSPLWFEGLRHRAKKRKVCSPMPIAKAIVRIIPTIVLLSIHFQCSYWGWAGKYTHNNYVSEDDVPQPKGEAEEELSRHPAPIRDWNNKSTISKQRGKDCLHTNFVTNFWQFHRIRPRKCLGINF